MKLKTLLTATLISLSGASMAQSTAWTYDSVALGAGYSNDVFYELGHGGTVLHSGNDWDLGFQMTVFGEPMFNAAIRANHVKKGLEVYNLGVAASTNWATLAPTDTVGKTSASQQLINADTSWGNGAFYQSRLLADPFSYGWGEYNMSSHYVTGDHLFLLKVAGVPYKFWMQQYISTPQSAISYTFKIAKLDGSNENTVTISRQAGYTDRLFAYYDIATNTVINREPSRNTWDMLFTQYRQRIDDGTGNFVPYNLTGVLTNLSTEVADIRHTDPDAVTNFKGTKRTGYTDEIGADWKRYDMAAGLYVMSDSTSFVIKSKLDLHYYQVQFLRFDGGSPTGQGKIVFRKRDVANAVSVPTTANHALNAFAISPNPATAGATLLLDAKQASAAQMIITDMAGRVMQSTSLDLKSGINAYSLNTASWPAGIYSVQVAAQDWNAASRIVVAH